MAVLRTARVKICRPLYEKQVLYPQCDLFRRKKNIPPETKIEHSKYSQPNIAETQKLWELSPLPSIRRILRIFPRDSRLIDPFVSLVACSDPIRTPPFVIHLYKVKYLRVKGDTASPRSLLDPRSGNIASLKVCCLRNGSTNGFTAQYTILAICGEKYVGSTSVSDGAVSRSG